MQRLSFDVHFPFCVRDRALVVKAGLEAGELPADLHTRGSSAVTDNPS